LNLQLSLVSGFRVSGFLVSGFQGFIQIGVGVGIGIGIAIAIGIGIVDPRRSTGTPAFPTPQVAFQGFRVSGFRVSGFQGFIQIGVGIAIGIAIAIGIVDPRRSTEKRASPPAAVTPPPLNAERPTPNSERRSEKLLAYKLPG